LRNKLLGASGATCVALEMTAQMEEISAQAALPATTGEQVQTVVACFELDAAHAHPSDVIKLPAPRRALAA